MNQAQQEMGDAYRISVIEQDGQDIISIEESWEDTANTPRPTQVKTFGQEHQPRYQTLSTEHALMIINQLSGSNQVGIDKIRTRIEDQYVTDPSEINKIIAWIYLTNADEDLAGDWMRHASIRGADLTLDGDIWGIFKKELSKLGVERKKKSR